MNKKKTDWRVINGLMIIFYVLGAIAFSIIADMSGVLNQAILAIFVVVIIRESVRFHRKIRFMRGRK